MTPPPTLQDLIETVRQDASSDQPLDQLVAAAAAAAQLEETTDALLGHFVDRCRHDGRSWSEISAALGVTKQAVHKRFASAVAAHLVAASPTPTFERFTDRARHVVAASREAAVEFGHQSVTTAHILLGLYAEPAGLAGRALAAMNISQDQAVAAVRAVAGHGSEASRPDEASKPDEQARAKSSEPDEASEPDERARAKSSEPGKPASDGAASEPKFSDEAKRALRDALTVALEFGHNYIGTEHILLGLYRNGESFAARTLVEAGALEATARTHITQMLRDLQQGR